MSTSKRPTCYSSVAPLLFLIGLFVLLSACRPIDQPLEPGTTEGTVRKTSRLAVLHTNDTWGYYDPCG
jgi:hypothetical protein